MGRKQEFYKSLIPGTILLFLLTIGCGGGKTAPRVVRYLNVVNTKTNEVVLVCKLDKEYRIENRILYHTIHKTGWTYIEIKLRNLGPNEKVTVFTVQDER